MVANEESERYTAEIEVLQQQEVRLTREFPLYSYARAAGYISLALSLYGCSKSAGFVEGVFAAASAGLVVGSYVLQLRNQAERSGISDKIWSLRRSRWNEKSDVWLGRTHRE